MLKYEPRGSIATYLLMNYIEIHGAMYSGVRPWALCICCWERHHPSIMYWNEAVSDTLMQGFVYLVMMQENWFILFASSTESSLVFRTLGARMAWYISENEKWCFAMIYISCDCSRTWNEVTVYFGWSHSQRFLLMEISQQFIVTKSSSLRLCHAHVAACRRFSLYAGAYSRF